MATTTRRDFLKLSAAGVAGLYLGGRWTGGRMPASVQVAQTPLPGKNIPQFVEPLPVFGPAGPISRVTGTSVTVTMNEVQQKVLPASFYTPLAAPYNAGTYVWAYKVGNSLPIPLYPGVTIEAQRNVATYVTYVNDLPTSGSHVQQYLTVDQTLHWANPLGLSMTDPARMDPYAGPPPTVTHLHGAEVPSEFDGGPDGWFTPDGIHGAGYETLGTPASNAAVYWYPNTQEATTLWFHDHTLGATRLNVYAGLAAFYLLRDGRDTGLPNNPIGLSAGPYEIEIVIQDRMFDTNGQWLFPDLGINPAVHPFWLPEFFGDAVVVNGKTWPFLEVEPRRYRFRFLDGSNARFYELRLMNRATKAPGPAFWVIGTDGGLLNAPVKLNDPTLNNSPRLVLAPGERYDTIIDFSGYQGQTLTLVNSAKGPFPKGKPADPQTVGQIMQFRVTKPLQGTDNSYNPAAPATQLRNSPIKVLDPAISGKTPDRKRQLTLNEVIGPGGPLEVLVNNTKWNGRRTDADHTPIPGSVPDSHGNYLTELPEIGSTEVWEIINLTADAHPIHLHLVQFQSISRQMFNVSQYTKAYNALFPGGTYNGIVYAAGTFIPAYGPPSPYFTANAGGFLGGNPDVTPFLQGAPAPPSPEEAGWKDTFKMFPGEVTRVAVRWASQDKDVASTNAGDTNAYPFNASTGPGYVWHCHIIDHEDNEMMRPYNVQSYEL